MKRTVLVLMLILILPSCYSGELFDETSLKSESEAAVLSKYNYSPSLSSKDRISEVGITVDGITVEAQKYIYASYTCTAYDAERETYLYSSYGESVLDYDEELLGSIPIMRGGAKAEITVMGEDPANSTAIYCLEGQQVYDVTKSNIVELPQEKGVDFLVVKLSADHPRRNESITPTVGERYVSEYQYVVGIVVE